MREKRIITTYNKRQCWGMALLLSILSSPLCAQYADNYYQQPYQDTYQNQAPGSYQDYYPPNNRPDPNLQYDPRDAEMILREQVQRSRGSGGRQGQQEYQQPQPDQGAAYDNYYGHRVQGEAQVQAVMQEARYIAGMIKTRNGKPFLIVDKRSYQFYLYDREGKLLRIGPVAIGKGKTHVGAFETPVGIFPISSKVPVADWVRPDWYFIEEGEPIPKSMEERRVPGFFRYKLVFDGSRYVHYAEATGGRLTHGCLGLDWLDAEAVFHTMQVGSYCIIVDQAFLGRLARGEFPVSNQVQVSKKPDEPRPAAPARVEPERRSVSSEQLSGGDDKTFRSLW
jgi:lipoprotein-anchoring transpeptidase ErfK/SrfK